MVRLVLLLVLAIIISRMFWRIVRSFGDGLSGGQPRVPPRGVPMVRDPVCGTFVLAERAVELVEGRSRVFFCSDACRDKYRARRGSVEGRTA